MTNLQENWKAIPGYEGIYEASDLGRIKSLARTRTSHHQTLAQIKERIISKRKSGKYLSVTLIKNSERQIFLVHRLIMFVFKGLPKEDQKCVLHLNDDPYDNRLVNLKYGTHKENSQDALQKGRLVDIRSLAVKGREVIKQKRSKPIVGIDSEGNRKEFINVKEAGRVLNLNHKNIHMVCKGKRKKAGGYEFYYLTSDNQ